MKIQTVDGVRRRIGLAAMALLLGACGGMNEFQNVVDDLSGKGRAPETEGDSAGEDTGSAAGTSARSEERSEVKASPATTSASSGQANEAQTELEADEGFFGGLGAAAAGVAKVGGAINGADNGRGMDFPPMGGRPGTPAGRRAGQPGGFGAGNGGAGNGGANTSQSTATCCVNQRFYTCPDVGAAARCLGEPMRLFQCMQSCNDGNCSTKCADQYGPDPSKCSRQPAQDQTCPARR